jgi:hypothetical protein
MALAGRLVVALSEAKPSVFLGCQRLSRDQVCQKIERNEIRVNIGLSRRCSLRELDAGFGLISKL